MGGTPAGFITDCSEVKSTVPTAAKQARVEALREKLTRARGAYLTSSNALTVPEVTDLRAMLRRERIEYHVVKNTLLKIAAEDTPVSKLGSLLEGPSAVALSFDDPVSAARVLTKYARGQQKLTLRAAVVDGGLVHARDLQALADLPGREVLLAQLLSVLGSVSGRLVSVLAALPRSLVNVLDAIRAEKAKAEGAA